MHKLLSKIAKVPIRPYSLVKTVRFNKLAKTPLFLISDKEKEEVKKIYEQMTNFVESDLQKLIYANTASEIIDVINAGNIKKPEHISFALFHLAGYDIKFNEINTQKLSNAISFFLSHFKSICTENQNLIFFLHSISKLAGDDRINLDTDLLYSNLIKETPYVLYNIYTCLELINISSYVSKLFRYEKMSFINFFEKNIRTHLLSKINQMEIREVIILLKLFLDCEYKDIEVVNKIEKRVEDFEIDEKKSHLQLIYLMHLLDIRKPEFFHDNIKKMMQNCVIEPTTEEDAKRQVEIWQRLSQLDQDLIDTMSIPDNVERMTQEKLLRQEKKALIKENDNLIRYRAMRDNLSINDYIEILNLIIEYFPEDKTLIKEVMGRLFLNKGHISSNNYIDLWLLLAYLQKKNSSFAYKPIVEELCVIGNSSLYISVSNMHGQQLLKIFISLANLRVENKDFVLAILNHLTPKLDTLTNDEVINLFKVFFVYSNLFENYYLVIHKELLKRLTSYTYDDLASLKQIFVLKKDLFGDSPLLKILNITN